MLRGGKRTDEGILADEDILPLSHRRRVLSSGNSPKAAVTIRRRRTVFIILAIITVVLLLVVVLGSRSPRKIAELHIQLHPQRPPSPPPTVKHVKTHIPSKVTNILEPGFELEEVGSNDGGGSRQGNTSFSRRPRFHILIAANKATSHMCKTLLSAAALNFPTPVLINNPSNDSQSQARTEHIHKTYDFLNGDQVQDSDLILILEEDSWFQLPAEVVIGRFLRSTRTSDAALLHKYGRKPPKINIDSSIIPIGAPRYEHKILFSAQKVCSNSPDDLACYSAPQSPLLTEIYGPTPDEYPGIKLDTPRYLGPTMAMGRVSDLRPLYSRAEEIRRSGSKLYSAQQILAQIFGKQEYVRSARADALNNDPMFATMTEFLLGPSDDNVAKTKPLPEDTKMKLGTNYEFGIGLDYMGSVFQVLHNSSNDTRFVEFKQPPTVPWPSLPPDSIFENLITLPADLLMGSPFTSPSTSSPNPNPPLHPEFDSMPRDNVSWPDVSLLTNIIVPSSSVPSIVNILSDESLQDELWRKMWFQRYGRALLRQSLRNTRDGVAAKNAAEGDEQWWDFRGGNGGVWMDDETWLEWNEVCGGFEEEVFGDGWGKFGAEWRTEGDGVLI